MVQPILKKFFINKNYNHISKSIKMKKQLLLLLLIAFFGGAVTIGQSFKPSLDMKAEANQLLTFSKELTKVSEPNSFSRSGSQETIYYESFANGLSGTGGGAWQALDNAGFCNWQHTTEKPKGQYSTNIQAINSPTSSNGFMILDGDFCNPGQPPSEEILDAYLISPSINLTNHLYVEIEFYHYYRYCCANNAAFTLQVSIDGGSEWFSYDIKDGLAVNSGSADPVRKTVNISSIAGGKPNVRFRFHKTGASHYFWMIDDVSLLVSLDNDLSINKVYAGDILNSYDYYSIPASQVPSSGMTFLTIIENTGNNVQYGYLYYEVLLGTQTVYQDYVWISIPSSTSNEILINSGFTPIQTGTYTLRVTVPDDENNANNTGSAPFEITDHIFGHIHPGTTTSYGLNTDAEFGLGNIYVLNNNQTAYGAKVKFAAQTTPGMEVELILFEVDQHQQYNNLWEPIDLLSAQSFIIQAEHIGSESFTNISFPQPVDLQSGKRYMLHVNKYYGSERMHISTSARGAEDWSTVVYTAATTGDMFYFKRNDFASAINLDFQPCEGITLSSQPQILTVIEGNSANFTVSATGTNLSYQWQVNTGSGFFNLSNAGVYSGVNTSNLNISSASSSMNGYSFRCIIGSGSCSETSSSAILNVLISNVSCNASILNGLIAYYPFCSNANDHSGNNRHASVNGPVLTTDRNNQSARAYDFNGLDDYIEVNSLPNFGNTISGAAWIYPRTYGEATGTGFGRIIDKGSVLFFIHETGGSAGNYSDNSLVLSIGENGENIAFNTPANTILLNQWQHVAFSVNLNSSSVKLFVNGVEQTLHYVSGMPSFIDDNTNTPLFIGERSDFQRAFNGKIDDLYLFNRTLTAAEISSLYCGIEITSHPQDKSVADGSSANFTVSATGSNLTYQWQVNTGTGFLNLSNAGVYSGVNTVSLNISNVSSSMDGYLYRCIVGSSCTVTSESAALRLKCAGGIASQPQDLSISEGNSANFSITTTGTGINYQWQVNMGSGFFNLNNAGAFSGVNTSNLMISNVSFSMNGYIFRCTITSGSCTEVSSSALLTVKCSGGLVSQPQNVTVTDGNSASFSITTSGQANSFQWQANTGTGFINLSNGGVYSGVNTASLIISNAGSSMNGNLYRCIVISGTCTEISESAELKVKCAGGVVSQPQNISATEGSNASFTVSASGTSLSYQWQLNTGSGYFNLSNGGIYSGVNTYFLNISSVGSSMNGYLYRCIVTSGPCTETSESAILTVNCAGGIVSQPQNITVTDGNSANFTVTTSGNSNNYQWQANTGSGFFNLSNTGVYNGANTTTLSISSAGLFMNGYLYRCLVSSGSCTETSESALLTVKCIGGIVSQPQDLSVTEGAGANFTVTTSGTSNNYQWQANAGSGFFNLSNAGVYSGVNSSSLSISITSSAMSGYLLRCIVVTSASCTEISQSAVLNIKCAGGIVSQPLNSSVTEGAATIFTVTTSGTSNNYQWQVNTGSGYFNLSNAGVYSGANTSTLSISSTSLSMNGYLYRCIVNAGSCTETSVNAILTVLCSADIISQPQEVIVSEGSIATYSVVAAGSGVSYQWQVDIGTGYLNLSNAGNFSGVNTPNLNIGNASLSMNGYVFRCVLSAGSCIVTSQGAVLIVSCGSQISGQPVNKSVKPGENTYFAVKVTGTNYNFKWQANAGLGFQDLSEGGPYSGTSSDTLKITNASLTLNNYNFRCIVSSANCSDTSDVAILTVDENSGIKQLVAKEIKIYPNPTNSTLTMVSSENLSDAAISVISMTGQIVYRENNFSGQSLTIDMSALVSGIYFIELINNESVTRHRIVKQ
jgi:hypothetical protein